MAARPDYLGALTNLFRDVAAAVDEHLDVFREAFGPGELWHWVGCCWLGRCCWAW